MWASCSSVNVTCFVDWIYFCSDLCRSHLLRAPSETQGTNLEPDGVFGPSLDWQPSDKLFSWSQELRAVRTQFCPLSGQISSPKCPYVFWMFSWHCWNKRLLLLQISVTLWLGKTRTAVIMVKLWRLMRNWAAIYLINRYSNEQKKPVLTGNIAILRERKEKEISQKCHVFISGSPKKKKILTIFKMAARQRFSNICIGFLLTQSDLCPSTLWFSHYNNDFDCLFTILFEHFCLPYNIYWTSAVSFIGTCCIGTSIVCKFLKVKREIGSYPHLVDQENKGFQWNYSDVWEGESELGQDI